MKEQGTETQEGSGIPFIGRPFCTGPPGGHLTHMISFSPYGLLGGRSLALFEGSENSGSEVLNNLPRVTCSKAGVLI